jgi:alcohol dehydrogenase, propanol-preferring
MRAMVLERPGEALSQRDLPQPEPGSGELLVRVLACGVCRTDLHVVDGDLREPKLPLVPGHQAVGEVAGCGPGADGFEPGERVGIPWLGWTCGECRFCASGRENLCERGLFTGYTKDGGYADALVADARYAFRLPDGDPVGQAPLLCAGLVGYRALRLCGDAERIGLFGFGGSAHIVCQVAAHQGRRVFAVTRGGKGKREFARDLGAAWAGPAEDLPEELDAAIVFAPAGEVVVDALRALGRGGSVVCAGIHMSDIPPIAYEDLWHERQIRSVANLTRRDGEDFLPLAAEIPVRTRTITFGLEQANDALAALRDGAVEGAAVLEVVRDRSK